MTDEKKETPEAKAEAPKKESKEEAPAKAKKEPEKKAEEKTPTQAETKAPSEKIKKLSRLTLQEIEAELKTTQEKMGGMHSRYAQHLLLRKKALSQS